jgi:hypothetical protein
MKIKISYYSTTTGDAYVRCSGIIYLAITEFYIVLYPKRNKNYPCVYLFQDYIEINQSKNKRVTINKD